MSAVLHNTARQTLAAVFYGGIGFVAGMFVLVWLSQNGRSPLTSYVIQSGSMEPAIMTGDVIVTAATPPYQLSQVITFKEPTGRVVTHRIIAVDQDQSGQPLFTTQGDANQSPDPDQISLADTLGSVQLVIPKLGYMVAFIQSKYGIALFILVPACLLVYDEIKKLIGAVRSS